MILFLDSRLRGNDTIYVTPVSGAVQKCSDARHASLEE